MAKKRKSRTAKMKFKDFSTPLERVAFYLPCLMIITVIAMGTINYIH